MLGWTFFRRATIIITAIFFFTLDTNAQIGIKDFYLINLTENNAAAKVSYSTSLLNATFRNDFCIKELMYKDISFTWYRNKNALLTTLSHYGYSSFGELNYHLGYGRNFGDKISIAIEGIYKLNHARHYELTHSFVLDISACYPISPKFILTISAHNTLRLKYGIIGKEIIPMRFDFHLGYFPNKMIGGYLFCNKELPGQMNIGIGLAYSLNKYLILNGECSLMGIGIGMHLPWKQLMFGIHTKWNYRIGFSPECHLSYFL